MDFFDNKKGSREIKRFQCGLFYSEFPNVSYDLLKLYNAMNLH